MALPPIDTIRHLLERLRANDVTWFREKYKSGDLNWLKDHLPGDGFSKLGGQLEAGNLDGLRNALPEVPGLTELPGVGALLGGLGGVGAAGAAAASKLGGAVTGGASKATGAAADAARRTTTATTTMVSGDGNRKKGLAWLIPVVLIVAALAALGLTKCKNDDDEKVVPDATVVVDTSAAAVDTTAAVVETTPVESSVADAATTVAVAQDIISTAIGNGQFTKLGAAINAAGLTDTLKGPGPFTVFAPTDAAFDALPAGVLDGLLKPENKETLVKVLTYHVVAGKVLAADLKSGPVASVEGSELTLAAEGGVVTVDGVKVATADVVTSNGVIHVIDKVLVPKDVDLSTLSGGAPADPAATTVAAATGDAKDIVDTAVGAGTFTTLAAGLGAAGLVETLKGPGPFTVFAPTDDAFKALPAGLLDALLKPENKETLTKILTYHVVSGKVLAADVKSGPATSVEGSELTLVAEGGKVTVDGANVVTADIAASNGVVHVIDKVLVPKDVDVTALLGAASTVAEIKSVGAPESLTIYFDSGKTDIKNSEQDKLGTAKDALAALPKGSKVFIIGHADNRGDKESNKVLSIRRATEVEKALKASLGDKASNIEFTVDAVGDTQADADLSKSRKVTIEIQP